LIYLSKCAILKSVLTEVLFVKNIPRWLLLLVCGYLLVAPIIQLIWPGALEAAFLAVTVEPLSELACALQQFVKPLFEPLLAIILIIFMWKRLWRSVKKWGKKALPFLFS